MCFFSFFFFFEIIHLRRTCCWGACRSSTVKAHKRQMTKMGSRTVLRRQWLKLGTKCKKKMPKRPEFHYCHSFTLKSERIPNTHVFLLCHLLACTAYPSPLLFNSPAHSPTEFLALPPAGPWGQFLFPVSSCDSFSRMRLSASGR